MIDHGLVILDYAGTVRVTQSDAGVLTVHYDPTTILGRHIEAHYATQRRIARAVRGMVGAPHDTPVRYVAS